MRTTDAVCRQDRGQGLSEYAWIIVLLAIVVIIILAVFGTAVGEIYSNVVYTLSPTEEGSAPDDPPAECYGSFLLPIMLSCTDGAAVVSYLLPAKKPGDREHALGL